MFLGFVKGSSPPEIEKDVWEIPSWLGGPINYDLIVANINKSIIEKLIPQLSESNGLIILSGLLYSDFSSIESICIYNNLKILDISKKGEWICLVIK